VRSRERALGVLLSLRSYINSHSEITHEDCNQEDRRQKDPDAAQEPNAGQSRRPREGSISALIVELTKKHASVQEISKAVLKEFPQRPFAREIKAGKPHRGINFFRKEAMKKGWLPKSTKLVERSQA